MTVNTSKLLSRTVSARIPNELHKELCERCNRIGCSINDFIQGSLELVINDYTEFDLGNDEEEFEEETVPELKVTSIDGVPVKSEIVGIEY